MFTETTWWSSDRHLTASFALNIVVNLCFGKHFVPFGHSKFPSTQKHYYIHGKLCSPVTIGGPAKLLL
jgi:hypothetical protein